MKVSHVLTLGPNRRKAVEVARGGERGARGGAVTPASEGGQGRDMNMPMNTACTTARQREAPLSCVGKVEVVVNDLINSEPPFT